jgi:serine phosphatase RsbU (regulator of sigma subunit)
MGRISKRTSFGWLAWLVCVLTLALVVCAVALAILNDTDIYLLIYLIAVVLCALVGGVVTARRSANPVGWILLAGGAIFALQELSLEYAIYGLVTNPFSLPVVRVMAWLASWIYVPGLLLLLSFLPLYFPNGCLVSSRWRWIAGLALVLAVLGPVSSAFLPSPARSWDIVYPLGIVALWPVSDLFDQVATVIYFGVVFASAVSLVVRFHRSVGEERKQIEWLAYAASALTAWLLIDSLIWVDFPLLDEVVRPTMNGLLFAGIPVAVGVAVLRYRLYDIDLIINRTLVYGMLTGILAFVYLGSVVLLQDVFNALTGQEEQRQLAIVVSTLAIAALFIPLRRRIQAFIDKRFYRSKYDARKTLEAFSAKLRDEIDLDALSEALVAVVRETMQPTRVSLWLRPLERARGHNEKVTTAIGAPELEIAPNDPILTYLANASGVVELEKLDLDSPALRTMKAAKVKLVVPLVSQGELIGLLNLGPRLSQQEYSADDRKLLSDLSIQTAPAVRVAQLVRQQQQEAQERERIEQELRIARLIQQTLLPKTLPEIPGYDVAAYYQPAREVGGDFYDFFELEDGRLGLVVGDVTDKGVPAALVMATTRTMLRAAAQRLFSPGEVLRRANEALVTDIPPTMFITCLYAILEPESGRLLYANAGHDLPYRRRAGRSEGAQELRARGMPLGLMPGMDYEEKEVVLDRGESVLFYSDGLVEAHDPHYEMFGFPRLQGLVGTHRSGGSSLISFLLSELTRFTGEGWEQEDDITLVTLQRSEEL